MAHNGMFEREGLIMLVPFLVVVILGLLLAFRLFVR